MFPNGTIQNVVSGSQSTPVSEIKYVSLAANVDPWTNKTAQFVVDFPEEHATLCLLAVNGSSCRDDDAECAQVEAEAAEKLAKVNRN